MLRYTHHDGLFRLINKDWIYYFIFISLFQNLIAYTQTPAIKKGLPVSDQPVKILIDPGHGGRDFGATYDAHYEKNIALNIAKKLQHRLNQITGIRAALTREQDVFVKVIDRRRMASRMKVDLFISIHANASDDSHVKGALVVTLSQQGISRLNDIWQQEPYKHALRIQSGPNNMLLTPYPVPVSSLITRTSIRNTSILSQLLARSVLNTLQDNHILIHNHHTMKQDLIVLRALDVPSILIESGFMTNAQDLKQLTSANYQHHFADSVTQGLIDYLNKCPPEGTYAVNHMIYYTPNDYIVKAGDTLLKIAKQFNLSLNQIKTLNYLNINDMPKIGVRLKLKN
ncbi:MAG: LysM peptidoglycan-binding domain-containing protein [Endozoicomonadaceae bacterium]|nr:LysM peptidoglycan-binding domain-containing protein [Endozoicomonadaceae bacterium]